MERTEFTTLCEQLRQAAAAYYEGSGAQLMDDATYDRGVRTLAAEAAANGWDGADDLLGVVAGGQGTGDVPHTSPMLSLDNAMDEAEMAAFFARVEKACGAGVTFAVEPKLDGMALSVCYIDGKLDQIVTRGNGLAGEDVTRLAKASAGIPAELAEPLTVAVRGECVMTHVDFEAANLLRVGEGKPPFANPRNAVAGSLRSVHRTYAVPTSFFAYGMVGDGLDNLSHSDLMDKAEVLGFTTARSVCSATWPRIHRQPPLSVIAEIEAMRSTYEVDTDGAVVKVNEMAHRRTLGEGSRAPRWAIARKFAADTRETDLLDIEVAVGRTGNLSFTAKVEPVFVGGVTISSVTVHNVSEIARKGLRLPVKGGTPQRVVVRRAGEVIPEIVGRANDVTDGTAPFEPPTHCPSGHELNTSGIIWKCVCGRACALDAGLRYAVSRDCLDIEGMGTTIIEGLLVAGGVVNDLADLFILTEADLLAVPRLGSSNANKILAQIELAKSRPLARVFCALGVRGTGRSMSRRIATHFGSMDAIRQATVSQLCGVEGIGELKAESIVAELADLAPVLDRLALYGVGTPTPAPAGAKTEPGTATEAVSDPSGPLSLAGMVVCVTGAMTGPLAAYSRTEVGELIESLGGRVSSSVTAKTSFLLTPDADSGTGKAKKATDLGVEVVSPDQFAERYLAS
jgi:DNA ligase (NAD+)